MSSTLAVYLAEEHVANLSLDEESGGQRYSLQYLEAIAEEASGQAVLSASLRAQHEPFTTMETAPFFEGLLPEGELRDTVANRLRLSKSNAFGLLEELGRDCAGAVVLLPHDEPPEAAETGVTWLDPEALEKLVEELPTRPLGITAGSRGVRLSLAGVQRKAVLIRSPTGNFGEPRAYAPSTHILKPDYGTDDAPDLSVNEYFCTRVAQCAGLPTPQVELIEIGGRPCLLSQRFDRTTDGARTLRVHQEDLCQALGMMPSQKYQEREGGPAFHHLGSVINDLSALPAVDLDTAFKASIFNYVIGNADAHGKNFAFLYAELGPRLAPLYDLVSTTVYDFEVTMAMAIGDCFEPEEVRFKDWYELSQDLELRIQGFSEALAAAAERYLECCERVREAARTEDWHTPIIDQIVEVARVRQGLIASQTKE